MICYLIFSVLIAAAAFTVRRRSLLRLTGAAFYAVQAAFAVRIVAGGLYGETSAVWFAFDAAGTLFYCLLCIVSAFAFFHSKASLHDCDLRQTRTYAGLLMLLTTAIAGAYFASNLAVTWIFLEATTLCSAGIVYHRRTAQALEAAWKYVFVCSTGIAMAYLGILLLAAATDCESLDYATVAAAAPGGSALYLKTAFLLILCGYSCKAELFPLYTVGVDANFAAPAPASALISTGLVNAGFLALLRVYKLLAATEVFPWVKSVLLLVGVLSLVVGALFLRRTNNYKRFLSYSTVENMGIAAIGLGIGGIGVWAAVFHVVCHTLIKSSLFLQIDLCLLRAPKFPDWDADQGHHEFIYSFLPHTGSLNNSGVRSEAAKLNRPALAVPGVAAEAVSPLSLEAATVALTVVKKAEKEDCLVIRLVEQAGRNSQAVLTVPAGKRLVGTNLLEWTNDDVLTPEAGTVALTFRPYEIKTFKVV